MDNYSITVQNIGKEYHRGEIQTPNDRLLINEFTGIIKKPLKHLQRLYHGDIYGAIGLEDTFWAIQDISFNVNPGEVVGIIGRNGAGKSTLLKILSRITEPTKGYAEIRGRVGSLLEVGTGFHPDFTGRENVYFNGAILGMTKKEIDRKFDEIVDFAGVEEFIDTPIKFYSSGMNVRLAFAVAAHLETDILIVDEVLAVGDADFQRKCLGKMKNVTGEGRTVLFVSHNMMSVIELCPRAILLVGGKVLNDGPSDEVVNYYLRSGLHIKAQLEWPDISTAPGNDTVRLRAVSVRNEKGEVCEQADIREKVAVRIEYEILKEGIVCTPGFAIYTESGILAFYARERNTEWEEQKRAKGRYVSTGWIPGNFLSSGTMTLNVNIITPQPKITHVHEQGVMSFQVMDRIGPDTARGNYSSGHPGAVRPLLDWTTSLHSNGMKG